MLPQEADDLDFFSYHPSSIILGQNSQGHLACFNREGHVLVMAPPRSGKGVGFVLANCIAYQGSMVITDPKGENAAVTAKFRKQSLGHNVVILDPTKKLESYGLPTPTHSFNPLCVLQNANYAEVVDDIERLADALLVPQEGEKEQHWRDGARSVFKALLTYLTFYAPPEEQNLITFSRLANGLEGPLEDICLALTHNLHPDAVMRDVIAKAGAFWSQVNPKERASFVSVGLRSLSWLNSPVWHSHLRQSDFHPADLKAGKTTVYIVCPFEKLSDYAPWFRLVLSSCIVSVLREPKRSNISTLFMLDEYFATIGRLGMLEHSIPYMEGVGGRFAMVFQYLSQMTKLWPGEEYHGIFASAGAHVFFNATDKFTSEYISSYIGKYGALAPSANGMQFVQRDLLTPDEVRVHPEGDLIAFVRGYRPAWLGKLNIRTHISFEGRHDPNPTHMVLPEKPKSIEAPRTMLNAAEAIARAKSLNSSGESILVSIATKYPEKKIKVEGDFVGYDEAWFNPETGMQEVLFQPIAHKNLLV